MVKFKRADVDDVQVTRIIQSYNSQYEICLDFKIGNFDTQRLRLTPAQFERLKEAMATMFDISFYRGDSNA